MLEMSWITAILQLYSQVTDLFGNVFVKRINIRVFDLLARFHYILNLPRNSFIYKKTLNHTKFYEVIFSTKILKKNETHFILKTRGPMVL